MDRLKYLEKLERYIQKVETSFVAHNEVPGHPEICFESVMVARWWNCNLGSPESAANIRIDMPRDQSPEQCLAAAKRMVKWLEYDVALRERARVQAKLGKSN